MASLRELNVQEGDCVQIVPSHSWTPFILCYRVEKHPDDNYFYVSNTDVERLPVHKDRQCWGNVIDLHPLIKEYQEKINNLRKKKFDDSYEEEVRQIEIKALMKSLFNLIELCPHQYPKTFRLQDGTILPSDIRGREIVDFTEGFVAIEVFSGDTIVDKLLFHSSSPCLNLPLRFFIDRNVGFLIREDTELGLKVNKLDIKNRDNDKIEMLTEKEASSLPLAVEDILLNQYISQLRKTQSDNFMKLITFILRLSRRLGTIKLDSDSLTISEGTTATVTIDRNLDVRFYVGDLKLSREEKGILRLILYNYYRRVYYLL